MPFAVSLLFSSGIADIISARWTRLADADLSSSMSDLKYPPHVTLAVYDALAVDAAVASLDRAFDNIGQIPVTLTDFSTFGAGSGVCYAALAPSFDLMRLHAATIAAIGETCRPHYQTGRWTPHCTLATGMTDADMGRAMDLLEVDWRSLTGMFEAASLVELAPVVSIKHWTLPATPRSSHTP
jgi:2'-5' RNA ligase